MQLRKITRGFVVVLRLINKSDFGDAWNKIRQAVGKTEQFCLIFPVTLFNITLLSSLIEPGTSPHSTEAYKWQVFKLFARASNKLSLQNLPFSAKIYRNGNPRVFLPLNVLQEPRELFITENISSASITVLYCLYCAGLFICVYLFVFAVIHLIALSHTPLHIYTTYYRYWSNVYRLVGLAQAVNNMTASLFKMEGKCQEKYTVYVCLKLHCIHDGKDNLLKKIVQ